MTTKNPFLSVIIPIYRQEKTIIEDITHINNTLKNIRYTYEIIAVVDDKNGDKSYHLLKQNKLPNLKVYGYEGHKGKGYTVRFGMAKTNGELIAFIDAGMDIDPNGISMVLEHMIWYDADIIVGSKRHPASLIKYPFQRRIISLGAQIIARILLGIKVTDTQAGLKIFKRPVLVKVLPRLLVKEFAFDLEILSVANHLGFNRIYEAPVKINYDFDSLIHATGMKVVLSSLRDALAVFYRLRILNYYDDKSKRKWIYDKDLQMRVNTGETQ